MTRREISNQDDIVDSRDIIKRIEDLEEELDCLRDAVAERVNERDDSEEAKAKSDAGDYDLAIELGDAVAEAQENLDAWNEDYGEELAALKNLVEQAEGCRDCLYGTTLIHDAYFKDFAREEAEELCGIGFSTWPGTCIDWEQAADALKQEYTSVDWGGEKYWIRR